MSAPPGAGQARRRGSRARGRASGRDRHRFQVRGDGQLLSVGIGHKQLTNLQRTFFLQVSVVGNAIRIVRRLSGRQDQNSLLVSACPIRSKYAFVSEVRSISSTLSEVANSRTAGGYLRCWRHCGRKCQRKSQRWGKPSGWWRWARCRLLQLPSRSGCHPRRRSFPDVLPHWLRYRRWNSRAPANSWLDRKRTAAHIETPRSFDC